jgi:hypothetical protein
MPFNPGGLLGTLFAGNGYQALAPRPPPDNRTQWNGAFTGTGAAGADPYGQVGGPNNKNGMGPELGPTTPTSGPVPLGGWSQLGGHTNDLTGYITPGPQKPLGTTSMATQHNITNWTPQIPQTPAPAGPQNAPHAREPQSFTNQPLQPMLGQWGGGGWNTGSGAPASMQPMWLGSMNGGQTWGQAPGYNATAPKPGQSGSSVAGVNWSQAPNQDADSPTWKMV